MNGFFKLFIVYLFICIIFKVPFNWKARGYWPKSRMYLIGLNFRGFFLWCLAVLFQIAGFYFDFYQNHMAFWPQTSSFSFERDFKLLCMLLLSAACINIYEHFYNITHIFICKSSLLFFFLRFVTPSPFVIHFTI